jgi:ubiquinone/menaquinone biosynthesis C-methylase UbiE
MVGPRIVETVEGIQDEEIVKMFDDLKRMLRDRGLLETKEVIKAGVKSGYVLEVGSGPDYLGLEWLKNTKETKLTGLEISVNMIKVAQKNTKEYGLESRVRYVKGDAHRLPFTDNKFDGVFSCESLHEWEDPVVVFNEIYRVLKSGGKFFIGDLRRDINPLVKFLIKIFIRSRDMKEGFLSSIKAAYAPGEINEILKSTDVKSYKVHTDFMGLSIIGQKI